MCIKGDFCYLSGRRSGIAGGRGKCAIGGSNARRKKNIDSHRCKWGYEGNYAYSNDAGSDLCFPDMSDWASSSGVFAGTAKYRRPAVRLLITDF